MKRTPLKRKAPKKRRKPQSRSVLWAIRLRDGGACVACGTRCDPRTDRHHVLPVEHWPEHETKAENQVLACLQCHISHHAASRRIRYDELPEQVRTWVRTLGGREAMYLERTYPR